MIQPGGLRHCLCTAVLTPTRGFFFSGFIDAEELRAITVRLS